jgi:hypothetical protein
MLAYDRSVELSTIRPYEDGAQQQVEALLDAGLDIASADVRSFAEALARFDERIAYRERGGTRGAFLGGAARCAAILELLIRRGLPCPGELLERSRRSPEVTDVLLRLARPTTSELDAALLATCDEFAFDPNIIVMERLIGAGPTRDTLDEALLHAANGAARYVNVALEFRFFEAFDLLLAAGARADHGAGAKVTALHRFVTFSSPFTSGDRDVIKRAARADATLRRAIANVESVDVVEASGKTPLHLACIERIAERARMLVEAGADPLRVDADGKSAVDYAMRDERLHAVFGTPVPPLAPHRRTALPKAPTAPPAIDPLHVGVRVMHAKFGAGEIIKVDGSGPTRKLAIRFASGETRVLAASFVTPAE